MSVLAALVIWFLGSVLFGWLAARVFRASRDVPHPGASRYPVTFSRWYVRTQHFRV